MKFTDFEELKFTEDVKVGDKFDVGDLKFRVERKSVNNNDEMIFNCEIIGAQYKKRSKAVLIIPKKTPITTLIDGPVVDKDEAPFSPDELIAHTFLPHDGETTCIVNEGTALVAVSVAGELVKVLAPKGKNFNTMTESALMKFVEEHFG